MSGESSMRKFAWCVVALEAALGPDAPVLDLSTRLASGRYFADVVHPNIAGALALAPILSRRVLAAPGVSPARDCAGTPAPAERTAEE
jgi:hypothetical protein